MVLAWENLRRFFDIDLHFVVVVSFVDVLHSHFLFDIIPHPSVDYCQVFRRILYFQSRPSQTNLQHFHFSTIPLSSYCERYDFEWAFFTYRRFLHYAPSQYFTFLKVAGLHTDPRNTDPAHLFV